MSHDPTPSGGVRPLIGRHGAALLAFLRSRAPAGVDAEDLAQLVWLRLHRLLGEHGVIPDNPRAYLFRVARNALADARPLRMPQPMPENLAVPDSAPSPLESVLDDEYARRVADCVGRLSPQQADAVQRTAAGSKPAEIAAAFDVSAERVYKILHAARRSLAECLGIVGERS